MRHLIWMWMAWLLPWGLANAQPSDSAAPGGVAAATTATAPAAAEVVVLNRTVFEFRAAHTGISAQDRAKRAYARIRQQLEQPGAHAVSIAHDSAGRLVQLDGATSFVVTPADIDPALDETLDASAQRAAAALKLVAQEHTQAHSWDYLLRALGWTLLASTIAALTLWAGYRARGWLALQLIHTSSEHVHKLTVAGVPLLRRDRAVWAVRALVQGLYRLLVLVVLVEWLGYVLLQFPFSRSWGESLSVWLLEVLQRAVAFLADIVPELVIAVIILYCTHAATRALARFFALVQEGSVQLQWLDADMAAPTQRIATVLVWVFGLAMAYPYLPGSQTEAFKGLSVLMGLMVSLGASGMVGQAVSGMILTYGRIYRKGEYVRLGEHEGTVTELGAFTTRLRTGLGEEVTISNSSILAGTTKNYSRAVQGPGFVLDTTVTIGYDTPWRQVHAMLIEAASMTEGVLHNPQPQVFQTALSDWYPEYRLVCQAIPAQPRPRALLLSALHANIQDVFNRYGVQIMSPQYFEDPAEPKLVPPEKWYTAPAKAPRPDAP